jgi:hypothetical protein
MATQRRGKPADAHAGKISHGGFDGLRDIPFCMAGGKEQQRHDRKLTHTVLVQAGYAVQNGRLGQLKKTRFDRTRVRIGDFPRDEQHFVPTGRVFGAMADQE